MAQVMVNFRLDEDVKKDMEQACREMGLSMSTAFTIFAKKVGKERRIPFEVAASSAPPQGQSRPALPEREGAPELIQRQERLDRLCAAVRRSLTAISVAIPSSIPGLTMERIRLLCTDELKDKAAGASGAVKALFSSRNAETLGQKDLSLLDEYAAALSDISEQLLEIQHALIPAMRSGQGEQLGFEAYAQRLTAVSQAFDALPPLMQRFLSSTEHSGGARALRARIRQAALMVETPRVLAALDSLDELVLQSYSALEDQTKQRLEADYLQTLELTLWELSHAEREGGDTQGKAELCLRAVRVIDRVISRGRQARREWDGRRLEAEVTALERLAAMRGDVGPEPP